MRTNCPVASCLSRRLPSGRDSLTTTRIHAIVRAAVTLLAFLAMLATAGNLAAQSSSGTIRGAVRDASGALVPGAKIHVTHTGTLVTTETITNEAGLFVAPSMIAGDYRISVEATGFAVWQGALTLRAAQSAEVNVALAVSGTGDQITVVADVTALVTTDNGTVSNTLDRRRIEQLPMNGRDLSGLVGLTTPGVYYDGSGIRVDGLNVDAFEFVQDGAVTADRDGGGVLQQRLPGLDSVGEVRIETNSSSAKFNRPGTGIISTKAGTNSIHGSLFETNRDNGFGMARARQDHYANAPQLIRNEFGGSVGGPVYLPHLYNGKNRTFFFANWEALEQRQGVTKSFTVPTAAMRLGDFGGLINNLGQRTTLYDPLSTGSNSLRTPFVGNQIPLGRISPLAKQMYAITPLPTDPNVNPVIGNNWVGITPNNESDKTLTLRFDQNYGDKDKMYLRYSDGYRRQNYMGGNNWGPYTTDMAANVTYRPIFNKGGAFSWTHVFSTRLIGETVLSNNYTSSFYATGPKPNVNYASQLGLPNNFGMVGYPNISGTGFTQYGQNDTTRGSSQNISVIDQNFTLIHGRHQFQFGGRYRHERLHILPDMAAASGVNFSNLATAQLDVSSGTAYNAVYQTGHAAADFFLGHALSYQVNQNMTWYHFRDQEISSFFQDDFKVNSRLTLNVGVRWEIHPALHEMHGAFASFDMANKAMVLPTPLDELAKLGYTSSVIANLYTGLGVKFETPQQAGLPSGIWTTSWKNIAPRFGLAWKAFGNTHPTMIRAGYGMFFYPPPLRNFYASTKSDPPFQANYTVNYNVAAQSPDGLPNWLLRNVPTIIAGQNSANVVDTNSPTLVTPGGFTVQTLDPDYPPSYVQQWNFTIERELAFHTVVSVNYTGNHGSNLEQFWSYNDAPSDYIWYTTTGQAKPTGTYSSVLMRPFDNHTYGNILIQKKTGFSNNNSMKFQAQRLFKNGTAFQFFWTVSNAFRSGGNGWRDSTVFPETSFLPGTVSTNTDQRFRDLYYVRDTGVPKHMIQWNWVADLPMGKGKRFLGNSGRALDAVIGGWQFAGTGSARRWFWQPTLSDYVLSDVKVYGTDVPVMDCRSGSCQRGYLYYNGYLSPLYTGGQANGVSGLPADYTYSHQPLSPYNCSTATLCANNNVVVPLANGSKVTTSYNPGQNNLANPWHKVVFATPFNWTMNASLFKSFKITERVAARLQGDAFNVLNMPGLPNPDSTTGILSLQNSANSARVLQMSLRLTW